MLNFPENLFKSPPENIYLTSFNYVFINYFPPSPFLPVSHSLKSGTPFAFIYKDKHFNTQKNENFNCNISTDRPTYFGRYLDGAGAE
jgi:hypothetical protein